MKKISLSLALTLSLFAGEVRIGQGSMSFTGGFLGFDKTVSEDITTYSLVQEHANMLSSKAFYAYDVTWYDSKHFKQMQSTYNTGVTQLFSWMPGGSSTDVFVPTMDYRLQGLDASLSLGYDVFHLDENNYFGIGGYLGINLPWIDSQSDSSALDNLPAGVDANTLYDFYKASKTHIKTYKIGVTFRGRKALAPSLSAYVDAVVAYQNGNIENDYANSDFNVDGSYNSFDLGLRFQPYEKDFDLLGITWSPRVFMTLGYKMERWSVDDVAIDISGMGLSMPKTTMKFDTDVGYFGVGYSF